MASADGDEEPTMAEAPSTVDTGDATPKDGEGDMAQPTDAMDVKDVTQDGTQDGAQDGAQDDTQDNTSPVPVSNTATTSATASPAPAADAPDSPPRIVSDIAPPATVPVPPAPAAVSAAAQPPSVASPARTASPTVNGLVIARTTRSSMNKTPHQSPALPSPPVPLRASPAAIQPAPVVINNNNTHTKANKYQNNPTWRAETPRDYKKPQVAPIAIPPPAPAPSTPAPGAIRSVSFPSPGRELIHADQKFLDDKTRITFGIHQAIPEAVRRSVRDNWEKCLLGSDFHQAFVVSPVLPLPPSSGVDPPMSLPLPLPFLSAPHTAALFSCPRKHCPS